MKSQPPSSFVAEKSISIIGTNCKLISGLVPATVVHLFFKSGRTGD
jgi:hypothetical protein